MVVETIEKIIPLKTILFGGDGMLGHALHDVFPHALVMTHREVDITDQEEVLRIVKRINPAIVINAAAYTDVDGCEDNKSLAYAVNGRGPGYIAEACNETGATLVHYSTDYIFDGTRSGYKEDDPPNPINIYGESKLLGEACIIKNLDTFRIIRTSWLFGGHGKNFVDTILALSKQMAIVRVVNDQRGKPTYTMDLARKTPEIISCDPGIYHVTNEGVCSWFEFAQAFIPNAIACSTNEFPRRAKRPANSVLVNTKTTPLRQWKDAVRDYIHKKGSTAMKGIILAGGTGSRLHPLTKVTNKHLLPVYDKPMVYYPLHTLINAGIKDIMIVSGRGHAGHFLELLGSGNDFGITLTYEIQEKAGGIAQALGLAESWADADEVAVILGDNIFQDDVKDDVTSFRKGAKIFLKEVPDAKRFGVAELEGNRVVSIEEKPKHPKSDYAVTGLYLYDPEVFSTIRTLKPSGRGELEITDVNNAYLRKGVMQYALLKGFWSDAGTFDSLMRASVLVQQHTSGKHSDDQNLN